MTPKERARAWRSYCFDGTAKAIERARVTIPIDDMESEVAAQIRAAIAERDREWVDNLCPGGASWIKQRFTTPESYAGIRDEEVRLQREEIDAAIAQERERCERVAEETLEYAKNVEEEEALLTLWSNAYQRGIKEGGIRAAQRIVSAIRNSPTPTRHDPEE